MSSTDPSQRPKPPGQSAFDSDSPIASTARFLNTNTESPVSMTAAEASMDPLSPSATANAFGRQYHPRSGSVTSRTALFWGSSAQGPKANKPAQGARRDSASQRRSFHRRMSSASLASYHASTASPPLKTAIESLQALAKKGIALFFSLSLAAQIALCVLGLISLGIGVTVLVMGEKVFAWLEPKAEAWEQMKGGWILLWLATMSTAFPPMIGYSTCVTLGGFVFGMKGWLIIASANVLGSTLSFLLCRHLLTSLSARLAARDPLFASLSAVLARDGLPLLILVRLTPLPYSLSNGALSTIPAIRPIPFMIATAVAAPKLLIHVFIGTRLREVARGSQENVKMDGATKAVNWISIGGGVIVGVLTGWIIYTRTMERVESVRRQQQLEEGAGGFDDSSDSAELTEEVEREGGVIAMGLRHPDAFLDDDDEAGEGRETARLVDNDDIDFLGNEDDDTTKDGERYRDDS